AFLERKVANFVELRLGAHNLAAAGGEFADLAQIGARNDWHGVTDVWRSPDIHVVFISEQVGTGGAHVALDGGGASGKQKHDVLAELGQFAFVAGAEAFADAHQQEQGSYAPGDAEPGEKGA